MAYTISETETKREKDHRRFEVLKDGAKMPYVVSIQHIGTMECSCPAGVTQKPCKHLGLVQKFAGI
jgi:hypothetical protein